MAQLAAAAQRLLGQRCIGRLQQAKRASATHDSRDKGCAFEDARQQAEELAWKLHETCGEARHRAYEGPLWSVPFWADSFLKKLYLRGCGAGDRE